MAQRINAAARGKSGLAERSIGGGARCMSALSSCALGAAVIFATVPPFESVAALLPTKSGSQSLPNS